MTKLKGLTALLLYCLLVTAAYYLAYWLKDWSAQVVFIITFVLGLLIWIENMRSSLRYGGGSGFCCMLFFIIPSLVLSGLGLFSLFTNQLKWISIDLLYSIFHGPFIYGLAPVLNFTARPVLSFILPSGIILLLFIILFIEHLVDANRIQNSNYIFR